MNILISGVGGPTPLGIAKSLRLKYGADKVRMIGIDGNKLAPGLYNKELFDKTYLVPHSHSPQYWDVIEKIVKEERIDHAFIIPETEVIVWSKRQKEYGLPCGSLIPDFDVAEVFYDKFRTFDHLKETGIVPESLKLSADTDIASIGETLGYPYWIRGGSGAGAIGAYKITELKDLQNWLNINPHIEDFLASVFLPGRNYASKLLFIDDKLVRSATGERIDYLLSAAAPSGISGMCARGSLLNDPAMVDSSEKAIRKIFEAHNLPVHGMFTVDYKGDKEGNPKITEINIRHVSFSHAFALAGANFAVDTLDIYSGNDFDMQYKMYEFDDEYTFIRGVDSDLFLIRNSDIVQPFE